MSWLFLEIVLISADCHWSNVFVLKTLQENHVGKVIVFDLKGFTLLFNRFG